MSLNIDNINIFLNKILTKIHPTLVVIMMIFALYWLITIYNYRTGWELGYAEGKLMNDACQYMPSWLDNISTGK